MVQTENIPSSRSFFIQIRNILRELVSNAIDATSKLQTLSSRGVAKGELGDLHHRYCIDENAKTLTIRDRGIGLTEDEAKNI